MRTPVFAGLIALACCGCGTDYQEFADDQVDSILKDAETKVEAIPFFEQKGRYFDADGTTTVDRDVVLPMLKVLKEIAPTEQWVIPDNDDPKTAFAVYVKMPSDLKIGSRMVDAVEYADDQFSGFILQQWGHDWFYFQLIDKETYEFHKANRPNMDQQRPDSLRAS